MISIYSELPENIITNLKNCENIIFKDSDVPMIGLYESESATKMFLEFLQNDNNNDTVLYPTFGHPCNPYITPFTQIEVFNLLQTYKSYNNEFIIAKLPFYGACIQYNSYKSIYSVCLEIQKTSHNECTFLKNLEFGQIICDINVIFSNIIVVVRLKSN
jgi:hypothetical protein